MSQLINVIEYIDREYRYKIIYDEIVDFGESDKMIQISGKMVKSDSYKGFSSNI